MAQWELITLIIWQIQFLTHDNYYLQQSTVQPLSAAALYDHNPHHHQLIYHHHHHHENYHWNGYSTFCSSHVTCCLPHQCHSLSVFLTQVHLFFICSYIFPEPMTVMQANCYSPFVDWMEMLKAFQEECQNMVMRSHYFWPRKLKNCTIPVNLEAIQTTMIANKLFWPLYLGYNQILHYIVYDLQLSNFNTSLAFTYDQHPQTYPLSPQEVKLPAIAAIQHKNSLIWPQASIGACS